MELFESTKSHYGCSHELTLKHLSELAVFYKSRNDQKLTMTVMETLKTTIIDIISTEKDSKRLFDCSTKIAKIYVSQGHTHEAYDILAELRLQIISRDTRNSEKCGFKFDQNIDRRSFVFLATFQECLKNTVHINFSEIMADFLVENIMHEAYTRSLTQKTVGFETIMAHGARLRYFRKGKYDTRDSRIDDELFEAFKLRMGSGIKTSTATTRYFFINVLLEEAGKSQHDVHLVKTGCVSGAAAVRVLLEQSKFQEANDLSNCILQFTISHHGFHDQEIINSGFKLALYLAGRGAQPCPEKDPRRKQMMDLSKTFVQEILEACRHIHVDFTKTGLPELNDLVTLLGTQQNYTDLEVSCILWQLEFSCINTNSSGFLLNFGILDTKHRGQPSQLSTSGDASWRFASLTGMISYLLFICGRIFAIMSVEFGALSITPHYKCTLFFRNFILPPVNLRKPWAYITKS